MKTFRPKVPSFLRAFLSCALACALAALLCLASGCALDGSAPAGETDAGAVQQSTGSGSAKSVSVAESGTYTGKDDVARYIHLFGHLPSNFISKTKAKKAGWIPTRGNLQEVLPGKSIGGGPFYNDDGLLPDADGRVWRECDIDYHGGARGPKRIVYSNDGMVYYTPDHYEHFERLY